MTDYVLSIDPGWSTGVVLIGYDNSSVWLEQAYQFEGGRSGLAEFLNRHWVKSGWDSWNDSPRYERFDTHKGLAAFTEEHEDYGDWENPHPADLTVIVEKFSPRPNEKFNLTLRAVEPLVCEGTLIDRGLVPDYSAKIKEWRQPKDQYVVGGKDLDDKKKRQHKFLEGSGFYIGRKEIGDTRKDYDDARSATAHALDYLTKVKKHRPAWDLITEWSAQHGN